MNHLREKESDQERKNIGQAIKDLLNKRESFVDFSCYLLD